MKEAAELMVTVKGGWLYFTTNKGTATKAFSSLCEALEKAGVDISNIEFKEAELRDENFDTIDTVSF